MKKSRSQRIFPPLIAAALLAACGRGSMPPSAVLLAPNNGTANFRSRGAVYIGVGTSVEVYSKQGAAKLSSITSGISGPSAFAFDRFGTFYVSNKGANTVTLYHPGSTSLLRTISNGISKPQALASHSSLYVANYGTSSIGVYSPAGTLQESITKGVQNPVSIAVDRQGTLYVGNLLAPVTVYLPRASAPTHTISLGNRGGAQIQSLIVDDAGYLYVAASSFVVKAFQSTGVLVFAPGSFKKPLRVLNPAAAFGYSTSGTGGVYSLAVDRSGNVYAGVTDCTVGSEGSGSFGCDAPYYGGVVVYSAQGARRLRVIRSNFSPGPLVVDKTGNLYVADCAEARCKGGGVVRVYAPNQTSPLRKLAFTGLPSALEVEP